MSNTEQKKTKFHLAKSKENEGTAEQGKKKNKVVSTIINVVLVIAIVLAILATYVSFVSTSGSGVPSILGLRIFSIQTDSMYDTLMPGDLIVDTAVKDPAKLKKNDIITYWTIIDGERVLNTHRIVEIYDANGYLIFATKGDNNTTVDTLTVHESEIVGKYSFRIGGLGKAFDYLQTSTGFLIVVVVPVVIFLIYQLIQFFRVLFEYQNVKNRIRFEQERGRTEDLIEEQKQREEEFKSQERERLEAELREKIRAELLASQQEETPAVEQETDQTNLD